MVSHLGRMCPVPRGTSINLTSILSNSGPHTKFTDFSLSMKQFVVLCRIMDSST